MKACLFVLTIVASLAGAGVLLDAGPSQASECGASSRSALRAIGVCYLESSKQTEVSIHIAPRSRSGETIPAEIVLVALFNGDVTKPDAVVDPPDWLNIQAQASPLIVHSSRAFTITIPGSPTVDLLAPPAKVFEGYACDQCGLTDLRVLLDPKILLDLAHAHGVAANLFGMPCELNQQDIDAIAAFARRINVLT